MVRSLPNGKGFCRHLVTTAFVGGGVVRGMANGSALPAHVKELSEHRSKERKGKDVALTEP
jgi:hypothetical protein